MAEFNCSSIVAITGGSFQGKSLTSLSIASAYAFSGVLRTDCVRNILRVQNPEEKWLGPPAKLSSELFEKQRQAVSSLLWESLYYYANRGEKMVVEGIHLSRDFLSKVVKNGGIVFALNNQRTWEDRARLKMLTRTKTRKFDPSSGVEYYVDSTPNDALQNSAYMQDAIGFKRIHDLLIEDSNSCGGHVVKFDELKNAHAQICDILDQRISGTHPVGD